MKSALFSIISLCLFAFAALAREDRRPTQLIIDTDFGGMNGDIDDLGALALAHGLANNGECELIAIVSCIGSKHALQAIDVANTYFGRGDIPLGHKGAAMHDAEPTFAAYLAENFEYDLSSGEIKEATRLYREILAASPDRSITIAVIGNLSNIRALLDSQGDEISPLNGIDLVAKKVDTFYIMGGGYPSGFEANFQYSGECGAQFVLEHCPSPMIFNGFKIGNMDYGYSTGARLAELPDDSPIKACFQYWFRNPVDWYWNEPSDSIREHHHWDQITTLLAVRGVRDWFHVENHGYNTADCEGQNQWMTDKDKPNHSYLEPKEDPHSFSNTVIEPLMMSLPQE